MRPTWLTLLVLALDVVPVRAQRSDAARPTRGVRVLVGPNVLVRRDGDVPHVESHAAAHPSDARRLAATPIAFTRADDSYATKGLPVGGWRPIVAAVQPVVTIVAPMAQSACVAAARHCMGRLHRGGVASDTRRVARDSAGTSRACTCMLAHDERACACDRRLVARVRRSHTG